MSHFIYTFCRDPQKEYKSEEENQEDASRIFQTFKNYAKVQNVDPTFAGDHMIKLGVTNAKGKLVESYESNCCCSASQ